MTNQELIEMAEKVYGKCDWHDSALAHLEQLAKLVIEHEREAVANWIMGKGFATGHGDDIVNMLDELEWQIAEREREACAECGADGGHALYCVACAEKFIAQTETKDDPVATVISESGANVTHSWWHEPALPIGTKLYIKENT